MPPLRERKEDIPLLVRGFLRHFCKANEKPLLDLTGDAMNALLTYDWPGNVRELRTAIEHGVVMAHRPENYPARSAGERPPGGRRALPGGITPAEAFGEKSSPLDLHETEKRLDHAGARGDEWKYHRRGEKARDQPAHFAPQDQRDEPREEAQRRKDSAAGERLSAPTLMK